MRSPLTYGFLLLAVVGCRPSVEDQDLGEVLYELPHVPGAEEPYKLPRVDPEKQSAPETAAENPPETTGLDNPPAAKTADDPATAEQQPAEEDSEDAPK